MSPAPANVPENIMTCLFQLPFPLREALTLLFSFLHIPPFTENAEQEESTDSMDMSLGKLQELVMDREA